MNLPQPASTSNDEGRESGANHAEDSASAGRDATHVPLLPTPQHAAAADAPDITDTAHTSNTSAAAGSFPTVGCPSTAWGTA